MTTEDARGCGYGCSDANHCGVALSAVSGLLIGVAWDQ